MRCLFFLGIFFFYLYIYLFIPTNYSIFLFYPLYQLTLPFFGEHHLTLPHKTIPVHKNLSNVPVCVTFVCSGMCQNDLKQIPVQYPSLLRLNSNLHLQP
jgi:hypothetical protein